MAETLIQFLTKFITDERLKRFEEVLPHRTRHLTLVLENVFHTHNASACLRTCDCLGIQDVHLIESQNRFKPNIDISLGASQWLTTHRYRLTAESGTLRNELAHAETDRCIRQLRADGYRIVATSPRQSSKPLSDLNADQKTAVFFGAEKFGVSDYAISQADELIHVPMFGFTESFNISVSVALVFQHLLNRLQGSDLSWRLSNEERQELCLQWVKRSLGAKLDPLCRRHVEDQQGSLQHQ